jgi:hypothetical protein
MASFGPLALLLDARRTVGAGGLPVKRMPDLGPSGTNWMPRDITGADPVGVAGAIGGNIGIEIATGTITSFGRGRSGAEASMPPLSRTIRLPATVAFVGLSHDVAASRAIVTSSPADLKLVGRATGAINMISQAGAMSIQSADGFTQNDVPFICTAVFNGANSFARVDGQVAVSGDLGIPSAPVTTLAIGYSAFDGFLGLNGILGLLAIYERALDLSRLVGLERFLDRDWNLRKGLA